MTTTGTKEKPKNTRKPRQSTKTGQQIGMEDIEITDSDQIMAVKDWWELELGLNIAKRNMDFTEREKALKLAKEKALKMISIPEDGKKHRIKVAWDGGGTVIKTSPPGEPTEKMTKRVPKTQIRLDNTKPPKEE